MADLYKQKGILMNAFLFDFFTNDWKWRVVKSEVGGECRMITLQTSFCVVLNGFDTLKPNEIKPDRPELSGQG